MEFVNIGRITFMMLTDRCEAKESKKEHGKGHNWSRYTAEQQRVHLAVE